MINVKLGRRQDLNYQILLPNNGAWKNIDALDYNFGVQLTH